MSEKDEFLGCQVGPIERCLQSVLTLTASKLAGKLYFSLISGVKMPQICSICEKSAYYTAESGVKSVLSAVQSGIFGEISMILTFFCRYSTL